MTWTMHDREFESVLSLPHQERYEYFVKRVADRNEVWSLLRNGKWVIAGDDEGNELIPVWPHPRFAEACVSAEWDGAIPASIPLSQWLERWLPGIARDRRLIAVFPTPQNKGVRMTSDRLRQDLEEELSKIE